MKKTSKKKVATLKAGVYRHTNGEFYLLDGYIRSHETGAITVLYTPLYTNPKYKGPRKSHTSIERWKKSFKFHGPVF